MTNAPSGLPKEFVPMRAAYELRLARKAHQLGAAWAGTWGRQKQISLETQERLLGGEGDFRLSPFPYPGLRSFDPKEGKIFFGRERNVSDVQQRLANSGIVVVLGGSGSGKSSLVRAGLLPYLNSKRRIQGRVGSWYKAEFRPRIDPLRELADALADQVQFPLLALEAPGLAEAMGLQAGDGGGDAKQKLRAKMQERFDAAKQKGRESVRQTLLDFVDRDLDHYDHLASEGMRVPGASLMLLLDQFEEVFRPEIDASERTALLDLVVDLNTCLSQRNEKNERTYKGGLFLVVTMRSEELHQCAEHRGLAEVVNGSVYLLDLLDPENQEDAVDLHKAIVEPARNVFDDWGLAYDRDEPDAPFAKGMPAWLLSGAGRRLEHQPDRLPLLQHALQAIWHASMRRWSKDGFAGAQLVITPEDLPGQRIPLPAIPDLGNCLSVRADKAADRAKERFAEKAGTSTADGEILLQAAARSLARRDDRGNWARRFAEMTDIIAFLGADKAAVRIKERFAEKGGASAPKEAVQDALNEFLMRGYLSGGNGAPYDISHEALIRNWPRFKDWLRAPESAARALERVINEIDPRLPEAQRRQLILDWIPPSVSDQLAPVLGPEPSLPRTWALQQLEPMLERSAIKERWQCLAPGATDLELARVVLKEIDNIRQQADGERRNAEDQRYRQKLYRLAAFAAVVVTFAIVVTIWDNLGRATAALYASTADSLTGYSMSQRGVQMDPGLRSFVLLEAESLIDVGSDTRAEHRFFDVPAKFLAGAFSRFSGKPRLVDTDVTLGRARNNLDAATRESLGRTFAITGQKTGSLDEESHKPEPLTCALVDPDRPSQSWNFVGIRLGDKAKPAFRMDTGTDNPLKFGVLKEAGKGQGNVEEAISDLQAPLSRGAQLCLSSDARVLTLSSPGKFTPDLYELQWAPCLSIDANGVPDTKDCYDRSWRVRSIPINPALDPFSQTLKNFPCVTAIRHRLDKETRAGLLSLGRLQVEFTSVDSPANCPDLPKFSVPDKSYVAEIFAGLAVPRSVNISSAQRESFVECVPSPVNPEETICKLSGVIHTNGGDTSLKKDDLTDTTIAIRKRKPSGSDPPILEVDIQDGSSAALFATTQLTLPANKIVKAAITDSGEALLTDDAGVTWMFVAARSALTDRLHKRGCPGSNNEEARRILADLANDSDIDKLCKKMPEN